MAETLAFKGLSVPLPEGWVLGPELSPQTAIAADVESAASGFMTNVVIAEEFQLSTIEARLLRQAEVFQAVFSGGLIIDAEVLGPDRTRLYATWTGDVPVTYVQDRFSGCESELTVTVQMATILYGGAAELVDEIFDGIIW